MLFPLTALEARAKLPSISIMSSQSLDLHGSSDNGHEAGRNGFHFKAGSAQPPGQTPALQRAADELFVGLLDDVLRRLTRFAQSEEVSRQALDELFLALRDRKLALNPDEWQDFVVQCRQHPVMHALHQDPFTVRAFSKPRGYAGDAVMMDYIYGREEMWPCPAADPVGQCVFNYTTNAPASEGVRARRAYMASFIDRLAERRRQPHVLALASGHLREVNLSSAARRKRLGRLVALDADAESLQEVDSSYGRHGVETVTSSFRSLLTDKHDFGSFDLVYSTGLFDYLGQPIGRRLVAGMFRLLKRGGTLLVANFLPGVRDIGYMETFMDWNLVYRNRREMVDLSMEIPEDEIRQIKLFSEDQKNIAFLQVTRA